MAAAGSIFVDLLLRDASFNQGLNRARRQTKTAANSIKADFSGIRDQILSIAPAISAGAIFGRFIQNTINAQNEQAQLAAVLRSTGNAAGYTAEQLNSMARAFSANSIFSEGEITNAQTRLLSYTGVLGENIPAAMQAVIDQAARLGISVEQSAETVGRALEQPSKAAAALSRQGFGSYFTRDVVEGLKALEQQGRLAEAQIQILEVLQEGYGGAALAARETLGGALISLKNNVDTLLTAETGLPGLVDTINLFSKAAQTAAKEGGLWNAAINRLAVSYLELKIAIDERNLRSNQSTNLFGLNDRNIRELTQSIEDARAAQRLLVEEISTPNEVPFSAPSLPTAPVAPKVDYDAQIKQGKELESIYRRNREYIDGITRAEIQRADVIADLTKLLGTEYIPNQEALNDAVKRYDESLKESAVSLEDFSKKAAENIQDAFADFLFDPFQDGLQGMLKGFVDVVRRMIAEAQAAQLAKNLFGELAGGEGKGFLGGVFDSLGGLFGIGGGSSFESTAFRGASTIKPSFAAADGGSFGPGRWGVVGEEGPELLYTGNTGATIIPNGGMSGSNTYNIDARGADRGAVARIEQALFALAGPGVVEQRVSNAQIRGAL